MSSPSRTAGASSSASSSSLAAAAAAPAAAADTSPSTLSRTTAFRFHANNSKDPRDYDDKYRTLTLHADGTFTDYYEHLWDLKSGWVTEGVERIVYAGTYTLDLPQAAGSQVQLRYTMGRLPSGVFQAGSVPLGATAQMHGWLLRKSEKTACVLCPKGKISSTIGANNIAACQNCSAGFYSSAKRL